MWASERARASPTSTATAISTSWSASDGTLNYFKNTGTAIAPVFTRADRRGQSVQRRRRGIAACRASPTSTATAISTRWSGEARRHPELLQEHRHGARPGVRGATGAANPFNGVDVANRSTPAFADLDGDGDLDAVVGEQGGDLSFSGHRHGAAPPSRADRRGQPVQRHRCGCHERAQLRRPRWRRRSRRGGRGQRPQPALFRDTGAGFEFIVDVTAPAETRMRAVTMSVRRENRHASSGDIPAGHRCRPTDPTRLRLGTVTLRWAPRSRHHRRRSAAGSQ